MPTRSLPRRKTRRLMAGCEALESRTMLASLLANFRETPVAVGLTRPIAMALAPNGRIFVAEQNGAVRIVKNDVLLPRPFAKIETNAVSESGLIGIALDPHFATNQFVYVQYTTSPLEGAELHNRVSRFQADGDTVVPGSEKILIELDLHSSSYHMGGALHFGGDGKLYIAAGDNANTSQVAPLNSTFGKILRINSDGSIPTDNPFYQQTYGKYRAIWATGFRNPYTFAVQPGTGRIFINDVGAHNYEEINELQRGGNYGWPLAEGPSNHPSYIDPLYVYSKTSGEVHGAAIAGGAFYNPVQNRFPSHYHGDYFFADYGSGNIYVLDVDSRQATTFAAGAAWTTQPVDLAVDAKGRLYYLMLGDGNPSGGEIRRIAAIDKPTIVKLSNGVTYQPYSAPVRIARAATVNDPDSTNFGGGRLMVRINSGGQATDRLVLRPGGGVTLHGATVRVGGVRVGAVSGGRGATPLSLALVSTATPARVAAVMRNITFHNVANRPSRTPRAISVQLLNANGKVAASRPANVTVRVMGSVAQAAKLPITNRIAEKLTNSPTSHDAGAYLVSNSSPAPIAPANPNRPTLERWERSATPPDREQFAVTSLPPSRRFARLIHGDETAWLPLHDRACDELMSELLAANVDVREERSEVLLSHERRSLTHT